MGAGELARYKKRLATQRRDEWLEAKRAELKERGAGRFMLYALDEDVRKTKIAPETKSETKYTSNDVEQPTHPPTHPQNP
jgi:hypothetical protein